jgi:hypothetical protein
MRTIDDIVEDADNRMPDNLYRYQPPKLDRLESIILKDMLYYSSAASFNDPFDCRVVLDTDGTKPEKIKKVRNIIKNANPNWSRIKIEAKLKDMLLNGVLDHFKPSEVTQRLDSIAIVCTSEKKDNLLMWSHYAESHTGVCLEFSPKVGDLDKTFFSTFPIYYEKNVPVIKYFESELSDDIFEIIFTKSIDWEYEREWRIWQQDVAPGLNPFNSAKLTGIIFGCKAKPDFVDSVCEMNSRRRTPLATYKATMRDREFALDIAPL